MPAAADGTAPDLLEHPHLTTIGLLVEATAGMHAALERQLVGDGLSVQWFDVLLRLARTPGGRLRMSDLAAQTTLTASGLTRAVDRLEATGLVRREPCPSDRRGAFAVLTPDGAARVLGALPHHVAELEQAFAVFDRGRLSTFTDLLRTLRDAINPEAAAASRVDDA